MATVQHSVLTDPNLHEPKGVSTAASGKIYVANGSGSGAWEYPATHAFGEIYITGGTVTQTLSSSSALSKLNPTGGWTNNGNKNITLTGADGTMTVLQAGEYELNFWISFTTASIASGSKYYFHYNVDGTSSTRKVTLQKHTSGADILTVSSTGLVTLSVNDVLSIYVGGDGTSSGTTILPLEASFIATLIEPA